MAKKDVQLNIRMTRELKERIEASARLNNRTTNTEAITLLEKALESPMKFMVDSISLMSIEKSNGLVNENIEKIVSEAYFSALNEYISKNKLDFMDYVSDKIQEILIKNKS
ncbi:TPA: Arc family DNA-binding protein [Proteus mirabilis]|uniref:Arc family DNA-binding protein n=1 Tax=Proteus mirabilis TaxID=584 RepID=UPI0008817CE3|nr:Arc family DNA-binding protein [Proteus mirabilis]SDD07335.1 Arc-like DNA binding domain-containing protein [Proteus mirabilis]HEJ9469907.1 Arc family DNA-binding protein [Proteus mirabilis]